jgi:hypothetical protein
MSEVTRREFVAGLLASTAVPGATFQREKNAGMAKAEERAPELSLSEVSEEVDFRYAPRHSQATICFPDDPKKSLVGQAGDLRYGFAKELLVGMEDFSTVLTFSLAGMQDDRIVRQWLEAPGVPIVHTLIERPAATLELLAFATRREKEGRVDNVLMRIHSKNGRVPAIPKIHLRTCERLKLAKNETGLAIVSKEASTDQPYLIAGKAGGGFGSAALWEEAGYTLFLGHGEASTDDPLEYLIRLPQDGQTTEQIGNMLPKSEQLLAEAREWWKTWKPFDHVSWDYPGRSGEFLVACARNIQQAREFKDGRLVFQVGPTVYRGLWIVDGNFLLESARYLGYDREADEGLRSEWAKQLPSGQVVAAVPGEHWKDTAIAMFTLVRQCELSQDWSLFREIEPNVRKAVEFLIGVRDKARAGNSTNGKYGLLAPGFADGGIDGVRSEFTNTVWTLAGLKAVSEAAERLGMEALREAGQFYKELRAAFLAAARQEMIRHPQGFEYLPMLSREDMAMKDPDPWKRPRPQSAQWALSHAIFPGGVFDPSDTVVRGHIALLQSCTHEEIPAETGWLWHESVWNYNASFAAHIYLWAGQKDWAQRTFTGFLNHASPLYCWREEQPLQTALVGQDWGDMPHNWASAECVRYLRHMLVLEDGPRLRLLEGVNVRDSESPSAYILEHTPTRFGRVNLRLEPVDGGTRRTVFEREPSPLMPTSVEIPETLGSLRLARVEGAKHSVRGVRVLVDPAADRWIAVWK